eukprot:TRINITY_DN82900_c0_g1_i1.p1 TRINITY_DN82900_c0_g1~~TRINITY_DN82900_c0_g1_i1.p1  ORF type:complete len:341 (-),score=60.32 TRINITY_DN82900_c0_g1_i1:60-1034(-)
MSEAISAKPRVALPTLLGAAGGSLVGRGKSHCSSQSVVAGEKVLGATRASELSSAAAQDKPVQDVERPPWNFSTKPPPPKGSALTPNELEKRGVFWGDIEMLRALEKSPEVNRAKRHLKASEVPPLERGGAQSKATKSFRRHPRVWALITPAARPERYHHYSKKEHDSRDVNADIVDSGVQRVMLRMNPRINKYFERFDDMVDGLKPAMTELRQQISMLNESGMLDENLKVALIERIEASSASDLTYGGKSVMRPAVSDDVAKTKDRVGALKRDILSFLDSCEVDEAVNPSGVANRDFLQQKLIQQLDCFLAQAWLASSRPTAP